MSLLDEAMEECTILDKTTASDGYGGIVTTWTEGAEFMAAIAYDNSVAARVGSVEGLTSLYTVSTSRTVVLHFHDVFRRESDCKIFRVTSDGDDKKTPQSAGLNIRGVTAEEWSVGSITPKPTGGGSSG